MVVMRRDVGLVSGGALVALAALVSTTAQVGVMTAAAMASLGACVGYYGTPHTVGAVATVLALLGALAVRG